MISRLIKISCFKFDITIWKPVPILVKSFELVSCYLPWKKVSKCEMVVSRPGRAGSSRISIIRSEIGIFALRTSLSKIQQLLRYCVVRNSIYGCGKKRSTAKPQRQDKVSGEYFNEDTLTYFSACEFSCPSCSVDWTSFTAIHVIETHTNTMQYQGQILR